MSAAVPKVTEIFASFASKVLRFSRSVYAIIPSVMNVPRGCESFANRWNVLFAGKR